MIKVPRLAYGVSQAMLSVFWAVAATGGIPAHMSGGPLFWLFSAIHAAFALASCFQEEA